MSDSGALDGTRRERLPIFGWRPARGEVIACVVAGAIVVALMIAAARNVLDKPEPASGAGAPAVEG